MATLAEIRAKLAQQESKALGGGGGDNAVFPHWNIAENTTATIRFLPDGDPNNTFFWVEKAMIKLPFAGVVGDPTSKPVMVQVPCMEMWGETCPILAEVRTWFKDPSMEEMGRKYWKKRNYLFQGFVVDPASLKEDNVPENLIRRFIISPQLFTPIKAALMDPDMENLPTDYVSGTDFRIHKTMKGKFADYTSSSYARRERALNDSEMAAIEKHGLFNLKDFLPTKPTEMALKVMKEMFEASVDGKPYDGAKWGQFFRPSGLNAGGGDGDSAPRSAPKATARVVDADDDIPFDSAGTSTEFEVPVKPAVTTLLQTAAPATTTSKRAEDILAAIKARQNKA